MDSLTQIVLGAAVGEAVLGRKVGNKAMLWGAIAGTIPDLDVFMKYFVDELTATEMHRGFSHSILFAILLSPALGWLVSKIHIKEGVGWKGWSWLMFGSLVTHPMLDAHTNWGTTLFWPIEYKVAYNNIFIADPLYTIPFLVCVIWAMTLHRSNPKRWKINKIGLIISSTYMALTLVSKGIGYHQFIKNLDDQNIEYSDMITNPTVFNSIMWTALVETEDEYLVGYYSLFDGAEPIEFTHFNKNHDALGDLAEEDIVKRLVKLSQGWYVVINDGKKTYINDMRFGQIGLTDDPDSFPFSHEVWYENDVLQVQQRERDRANFGDAIGTMLKRVLGK